MIIIGIDPGTTAMGFAVIETVAPSPRLIASGLIPVKSSASHKRLAELYRGLESLFAKWKPKAVAVEKLFFSKNVKTAISVSEARGVVLLTTALAGLNLYEYTPLEVKKIITGDGKADKTQVQKMVQLTLRNEIPPKTKDDIFDAVALALACHYNERRSDLLLANSAKN